MGTIDPAPRPVRAQPAPAQKPPVMPQKPSMTAAGAIGVTFGLILFTLGSLAGWNLMLMGVGLVFIAAGYASRKKPPAKLCPSCRMEIPMEATVCGHCRSALPS